MCNETKTLLIFQPEMLKCIIFNEKGTSVSTFYLFEYQLNNMSKHISLRIC